jgi:hypothetical protein
LNRDVTVLIDGSGSMQGEPLDLAKRVVRELVGSLELGDRFELLVFSDRVEKLTSGLVYATPKLRQEAIDRLDRVQASGGTEMLDAVEQALGSLRNDAQRQIVLVTDGQVSFEAEVIGRIARQSLGGSRVHAVGIGSAPNRALLRGIAAAGRGVELSASDAATATEAALRLCTATVSPVLVDLSASGDAVLAAAPAAPRDVFAGQPALLTLELAPAGGTLELRGRLAGAAEPWVWRTTVPAAGADRPPASTLPIGAIHGRERILDLELEQMCTPDAAAIDVRIEACAMRHRIVSSRTSLVAIAEVPTVDPRAPRRRERLAVEVPLGVSAEGSGLLPGAVQWVMGSSMLFCFEAEMPLRSMAHRMKSSVFTGPVVARTERLGLAGTVLRVERGIVVLEFEVPFDDFELPRGGVEIRLPDGRTMRGRIDRTASSPAGPHAQGLLVRMALRLKRDQGWRDGATIEVIWKSSIVRWGGKRMPIEFTLVATLPPERGEHAAT